MCCVRPGFLDAKASCFCCVSVLMAPLGVKAAHALPVKSLKRVFASLLYMLAVYMLYKGIAG